MKKELRKLIEFTQECRDDMHEPDEQHLSAKVIGFHLDNAMGDRVSENAILGGFQEFVILLDNGVETLPVNLATLIALARKATL